MDPKLYSDIIKDIKSINGLNVYDTNYNLISKKYPSIPEETLRSIISLYFQRRVTQTSWRIKEINIYDLYKKLIASGTKEACVQIAHQLEYPPSLVAKIVLSSYLAEIKAKKGKLNATEMKNLRKQQCPCCKLLSSNSASSEASQKNNSSLMKSTNVKRHHDPRVELALNLFDDDDEIGKYFLEKFTFSNNKAKKGGFIDEKLEQKKSNKFFWQASSFEEMGEKNVKKFTNVEKLFSNRLGGSGFGTQFSSYSESDNLPNSSGRPRHLYLEDMESDAISSVNNMKLIDSSLNSETNNMVPFKDVKDRSKICELTSSSNDFETSSRLVSINDANSTFDELLHDSREGADLKICTCGSGTFSDDSDSDSEDSDEAYENFNVKELFENPSLIEDPVLARDVFYCTSFDDQYGPTSDVICSSSGITHEKLLEECVRNVGLEYKTEDKLRGDGFDKTPDIILIVPVAVRNFVINWIESKALFSDYKLHQDFEKKQFQNYVNRFGPGLVIYWHGYVNEVLKSDLVNKQIIISDKFPSKENFTFVKSDKFKLWMQSNGGHES